MNKQNRTTIISQIFIGFSIFSVGSVSILSILNPQMTMDLVQTPLPNNDAISSIRGIFGGVGLTITISLVYLLLKDIPKGLTFLTIFWGAYAFSRILTITVDGPLGAFGTQWLCIESFMFICAFTLLTIYKKPLSAGFAKNQENKQ